MPFLQIFRKNPLPKEHRQEFDQLLGELLVIGKKEDFLSEHPGGSFNGQCRHRRAREIGVRLDAMSGFAAMELAYNSVRRRLGKDLAAHLEYTWSGIGQWLP